MRYLAFNALSVGFFSEINLTSVKLIILNDFFVILNGFWAWYRDLLFDSAETQQNAPPPPRNLQK